MIFKHIIVIAWLPSIVPSMLVTLHSIEQGRHLHGLIIISELELDVFFEISVVDMYTQCVGV